LSTFERGLPIDQMAAKTVGAVDRADVLIFVKSMIYIRTQLLTSFWDAQGITFTVKTLPSLVISAVRLGVGLAQFEHAKIAVRRPAHGKILARGLRIAQRSLQRIAVKQGSATRRHGKVTHQSPP
jgi:hypothetical protein